MLSAFGVLTIEITAPPFLVRACSDPHCHSFFLIMHKAFITRLLFLWATFFILAPSLFSQQSTVAEKRISSFRFEGQSLHLLLNSLSFESDVPIGFEEKINCCDKTSPDVAIDTNGASVREILDIVVDKFPEYEWKIVDGVVNVCPKGEGQEILETKIKSFTFQNGSAYDLRKAITRIPEIRRGMKKLKLEFITLDFNLSRFGKRDTGISLDVQDASLREILNMIVTKGNTSYWVVSRIGDNHEFLVINF